MKEILRSKIVRSCIDCKEDKLIRKDSISVRCQSCRARLNSKNKIGKLIDITGLRFGRLIAIKPTNQVDKLFWWLCRCDCGNEINTSGNRLRSGKTKSCGCIVSIRHGLSTSPTYRSWGGMKQRCLNKNAINYNRYGALGITICKRWIDSFENFIYDMGDRPTGMTLDRIDPFGNYELSNCRWATPKDQCANKRKK